jgi:hypothetical protein
MEEIVKEHEKDQITVILTYWKRDTFRKQLVSILSQTVKPKEIWVYQNESHIDIPTVDLSGIDIPINFIHSKNKNFKFHGRFALPLLSDSEYTIIFDDDTIPGERWFENCLRLSRSRDCIIVANGRRIFENYDKPGETWQKSYGGTDFCLEDTPVDYGGHCWFYKTKWTKNMWLDKAYSWDNGEDIHFSAACKIYENIPTYVPHMPKEDRRYWGDLEGNLGQDHFATWRNPTHDSLRREITSYWVKKGWDFVDTGN